MEINQKLKNARINMNLTQEDVAEKIMISRQTISNCGIVTISCNCVGNVR